ncbi:MAG TPA: tripartite tricarboxylate transporter substrate binding protein [Burkholderiales bacterium]|jgi:tripartite-type tricarboxylate transporter receptor subunit TctC
MFKRALFVLLALAPAAQSQAQTQAWPDHAIHFVVGFTAGGPSDVLARALGQKMAESLKQAIVVDNRPGAGGNTAADVVAKSPADGYTWLLGNNSILATNAALYSKLPYDPVKDFIPVGLVATQPNILVVNPNVPVKSVKELIALAKSKPGQINFGSSGAGAAAHLAGQLFKTDAGIDIVHVPYKGAQPALTDLIAGQVQMMFATSASVMQFIKANRVRPLAVTSPKRMAELPAVPTMVEAGVPNFEAVTWHGIVVPAGTPEPVVKRIHAELERALASSAILNEFKTLGVSAAPGSSQAFVDYIKVETPKWSKVVRESGARID